MTDADSEQRLAALRPMLVRFARLHVRDDSQIEDIVQETLLAAFAGLERFAGQAQLETWVVGILRNKLVDHLRRKGREEKLLLSATDEDGDEDFDRHVDDLFIADGHWRDAPQDWGDPHSTLQEKQFMAVLQTCLENLPERLARIFTLREVLEFDTDEICKEVGLTATNCFVQLYRARMRLRECLQLRWFGELKPTA
jgi:RNA polymerase sigma-70 factor (ECF subfamily)